MTENVATIFTFPLINVITRIYDTFTSATSVFKQVAIKSLNVLVLAKVFKLNVTHEKL